MTPGCLELALVGIGNGGSRISGRLGLGDRALCVEIPFWIIAALRMMLARELGFGGRDDGLRIEISRESAKLKLLYISGPPACLMKLRESLAGGLTLSGDMEPTEAVVRLL